MLVFFGVVHESREQGAETRADVNGVGMQSAHIHAKGKARKVTDHETYPSLSKQSMLCLCILDLLTTACGQVNSSSLQDKL